MKSLIVVVATSIAILIGCASGSIGKTPEAQIAEGANALAAATTLATVLLRNDKLTVPQAKGFRVLLGASSTALDEANGALVACRKETATVAGVANDPCWPKVSDLVSLAINGIIGVKSALDSK